MLTFRAIILSQTEEGKGKIMKRLEEEEVCVKVDLSVSD